MKVFEKLGEYRDYKRRNSFFNTLARGDSEEIQEKAKAHRVKTYIYMGGTVLGGLGLEVASDQSHNAVFAGFVVSLVAMSKNAVLAGSYESGDNPVIINDVRRVQERFGKRTNNE